MVLMCAQPELRHDEESQLRTAAALHFTRPPVLCPSMQRFLRVIQVGLHLIQLQLGVDAFALSLLLLAERFLCQRAI